MQLVLYGSGEFTAQVNEIDRFLIDAYSLRSIAVIPAAAGQEADAHKWLTMATDHFKDFNIEVVEVPICTNADANNTQLVDLVSNVDWIFFSGGDPNFLLQTVKDSLLWDAVMKHLDSGRLLGGSSAGAMIMGSSIPAQMFKTLFTSEQTAWIPAFKLINYKVFPHFDRFKKHTLIMRRLINKNKDGSQPSWLGIDEDTAILFQDQSNSILGRGTVEIHEN